MKRIFEICFLELKLTMVKSNCCKSKLLYLCNFRQFMFYMRKVFLLLLFISSQFSFAQTQKEYSSTEIYNQIKKLNFLGSVLYVGAHPDDENTAMISYLSNKIHARTAYLAITRGDGGQNLIGPEMRELLGVIRTQELLAARRIDGGQQFFTRANDFGFSKNPEETFGTWDKKKVLSDVVWVFRKFRPDIIINRFDHRTEGDTHGHHTASARLSVEAFDKSGKENIFSNQLKYQKVWRPKKLYVNISWLKYGHKEKWRKMDKSNFLKVDLGEYLPIQGVSNTEISALSRSQHKSQGFGVMGSRGIDDDYLELIKGKFPKNDNSIFEGINTTWSRVEGGKEIGKILKGVQIDFDFKNPSASIPELLKAYKLIQNLNDEHWRTIKSGEIKKIIAACAGLYLQASSAKEWGTPSQLLEINLEAINRSNTKVKLKNVSFPSQEGGEDYKFEQDLKNNRDFQKTEQFKIPKNTKPTSPYWLCLPHTMAMYQVKKQQLIGLSETPPQFVLTFHTLIEEVPINFKRSLVYKVAKPEKGEVEEPFAIVPEVSVAMHNKTLIFADDSSKKVKVDVKAYKGNIAGTLKLDLPKKWEVSPQEIKLDFDQQEKGKTVTSTFTITPPKAESEATLNPEFISEEKTFSKELHIIDYPHIPTQTVLLPATTKVNRLNIKTRGKNIAYIKGSGDAMPQSLREIGYHVNVLSAKNMTLKSLKKYDAVVLGIRAYNTNENLVLHQDVLFNYIEQGGTVITQYNKSYNLKTEKLAPYQLHLSHNRVTDENSKIKFLAPKSPVLNVPNKITEKDFKGWVQERGLYFPDRWSSKFTPILGMHDKGETEMKGNLLVAQYGKGYFVYTGLSFFRELPAGVSGAFRLFANLVALGN